MTVQQGLRKGDNTLDGTRDRAVYRAILPDGLLGEWHDTEKEARLDLAGEPLPEPLTAADVTEQAVVGWINENPDRAQEVVDVAVRERDGVKVDVPAGGRD